MKRVIKYQFSENSSGTIIDINSLNKNDPSKEKYFCIGCKQEIIPRLGDERTHHFSHKKEISSCSKESYLHNLGKKVFFETYLHCIEEKEPFYIFSSLFCQLSTTCKYQNILKSENCKKNNFEFNLISNYKIIELEKNQGFFRPDITLKNNINEMIFIEIAVTHSCEKNKIESKNKIIEIFIKDESDIKVILDKKLSEDTGNVKFYNFERFNEIIEPFCTDDNIYDFEIIRKDDKKFTERNTKRNLCKKSFENKDTIITFHRIPSKVRKTTIKHLNCRGPKINEIDARMERKSKNYRGNYRSRY